MSTAESTDHKCGCVCCDPSLATPADVPEARYFTPQSLVPHRGRPVTVRAFRWLLDGEDISDDAWEAVAGEDGWATLFRRDHDGRRHSCRRCSNHACCNACCERRYGHVTYELHDPSSLAS